MRCILDGTAIHTPEELHRAIAGVLHFPDWYGGNLDALHDCLTSLPAPVELEIHGSDSLARALGCYTARLRRVLRDSAAENPMLTVIWDDAPVQDAPACAE